MGRYIGTQLHLGSTLWVHFHVFINKEHAHIFHQLQNTTRSCQAAKPMHFIV